MVQMKNGVDDDSNKQSPDIWPNNDPSDIPPYDAVVLLPSDAIVMDLDQNMQTPGKIFENIPSQICTVRPDRD